MASPVIEILRARRGRTPPFDDGARVALCVEGGAMRGVVSAGMVSALESLGLTGAFDAVYGSSAGALNAAYFLAGQATVGTTIYYEDINNARFIDLRRVFTKRPVVDLGFLLDDVARRRKPLDAGKVMAARAPFTILATDVATSAGVRLRDFADEAALFAALRAGATMPVVAGGARTIGGRHYFDASLTEPIPVPTAEADGHSHILVLLTRPSESPRTLSALDRYFVLPRLRRISPALAERYVNPGEAYATLLTHIAAGSGPLNRAVVHGIRPPAPVVGKLERRAGLLKAAAEGGYAAVMAAFGVEG